MGSYGKASAQEGAQNRHRLFRITATSIRWLSLCRPWTGLCVAYRPFFCLPAWLLETVKGVKGTGSTFFPGIVALFRANRLHCRPKTTLFTFPPKMHTEGRIADTISCAACVTDTQWQFNKFGYPQRGFLSNLIKLLKNNDRSKSK